MNLRLVSASALALALAACSTVPGEPVASVAAAPAPAPSQLQQLVDGVKLPYSRFTLDNGLTVVVHEDRKTPVVGVSVWYDVGSKFEPAGKTGFAHLFEHLMFNGSANAPEDWFQYVEAAGGTDVNGTTNADRTNYYQIVPTGSLDRILMLESDRMGHLLDGVTQAKLDTQRGVVQNEKRQGDNQPFGLLRYDIFENLFPKGHPYHHSTIGSMADLNAASLEDVKNWFRSHYGPNNAVLVLAGDIDEATARAKAQEWFGDIPRGPESVSPAVTVPTLDAPKTVVTTDQVPTTRIMRMWTVPGTNSPDYIPLMLGSHVLGGLSSSRLDDALVRQDPVAVSLGTAVYGFEDAGVFLVQADVRPGTDPQAVATKLDAQIAAYLSGGPTADEMERAKTDLMAGIVRGLESVGGGGGRAAELAEGQLFMKDPAYIEKQLAQLARTTPAEVSSLMRSWLSRPVFNYTVNPGERTAGGENRGGAATGGVPAADFAEAHYCPGRACDMAEMIAGTTAAADRSTLPPIGNLAALDFPAIERATLSNGIEVFFIRRATVPTVSVMVEFDAGRAAESRATLGTQKLLLETMDEGTQALDSTALAIAKERLGADIGGAMTGDWTTFTLSALSPNLAPSLDLLADFIRQPGLREGDIERVRAQLLNQLSGELKSPTGIAGRALSETLYGDYPYGLPSSGLGTAEGLKALSRADLERFHATWMRPDIARIYVVGDTTLAEAKTLLEKSFGDWRAPATPAPQRGYGVAIPAARQRIVLIDKPGAPQSVIYGGRVLPVKGTDDLTTLNAANEVLGGSFLARINSNLREDKSWSYGSYTGIAAGFDRAAFTISAPVQADRTGDALVELRKEIRDFDTAKGTTPAELARVVDSNVRALPGQFETSGDILGGLVNIVRYNRPDDWYDTLGARYSALTASTIDAAGRAQIEEPEVVYVVVGDAKTVRPQLARIGLPIEERAAR